MRHRLRRQSAPRDSTASGKSGLRYLPRNSTPLAAALAILNRFFPTFFPNLDRAFAEGKALLLAAIEEANADPKKPIAVVAVASLLTVASASNATSLEVPPGVDRNILGETSVQATHRVMSAVPPGTTES